LHGGPCDQITEDFTTHTVFCCFMKQGRAKRNRNDNAVHKDLSLNEKSK
jgi:hypothetical protein